MASNIIFSKKIIALFLLASTFFAMGYFFLPARQLVADECFEIELSPSPLHGTLIGTDLYVLNSVVSVVDTTNGTLVDITVGTGPQYATLVDTDLYVINAGSDNVSVIDTTTNTVTDTISVGDRPLRAVLVGTDLYVSNTDADTVSVIDTATNTVTDTISVGVEPSGLVAVGTNVYVFNVVGDTASVIDTSTNTVTDTITGFDFPYSQVVVGTDIYVSNGLTNTLSVIDTNTNTVTDTITVGLGGHSFLLINTDLYVANVSAGSVSVIDTNTNSVTATISGMSMPEYISQVGSFIYVSEYTGNSVSVININTNTLVDTIPVGTDPDFSILVGTDLYVLNYTSRSISVIDTLTNEVRDTCPPLLLTAEVTGETITLTYDENLDENSVPDISDFLLEINGNMVAITAVDIVDDTVILTIATEVVYGDDVALSYFAPSTEDPSQDPAGNDALSFSDQAVVNNSISCGFITVGFGPFSTSLVGTDLYVLNSSDNSISVIDTLTDQVTDTIPLSLPPYYSTLVGTELYVFDTNNGFEVVDTISNTVIDTVSYPSAISATTIGDNVYINIFTTLGQVSVYNVLTNTETATIAVGNSPHYSVLVGTDLYVVNLGSDNISVIDTATNTVTDTIAVGTGPRSAELVGTDLYVMNESGTVSVIDTNTNTLTDTITTGAGSLDAAWYDGILYVANSGAGTISFIDTNTNTVIDSIDIMAPAYSVDVVNNKLYITDGFQEVDVYDLNTGNPYVCNARMLRYIPGAGGTITGNTSQTVDDGEDGTPVTAVPNSGYEFTGWSDAVNDNPRTDIGVTANITVTANFSLISSGGGQQSAGSTGTSVHGRFRNLVIMGKFEEAYKLIEEYPDMFTLEHHVEYTFCDNASFTNFMKKKDVDGRYSAYYKDTVTEISKLQSFVNKLFMYQYIQASGPIDGIFGPLTKKGVERLQNLLNGAVELEQDLVIDGIVGPFTRSAVNDFCLG